MSDRVHVNRSGDKVWSPNTKEQLCEAVENLAAEISSLKVELAAVVRNCQKFHSADVPEAPQ